MMRLQQFEFVAKKCAITILYWHFFELERTNSLV